MADRENHSAAECILFDFDYSGVGALSLGGAVQESANSTALFHSDSDVLIWKSIQMIKFASARAVERNFL